MTAERMDNRPPVEAEIVNVTAIEAMARAEVDVQISTAHRFPRDVASFMRRAKTMIGEDPDLAAKCGYELEKGGKAIIGPSIRLAEIALVAWGNARVQVIEEPPQANDRFVRAFAIFHDLESNVAIRIPKIRRRTTRDGSIYNDDMTATTQNANVSVAYRDAVLRGIPRHFINELYAHAMRVAAGEVKDMKQARADFIKAWEDLGVTKERLLRGLEVEGEEGITLEHMGALRGLYGRVKRGEVPVADVFKAAEAPQAKPKETLGDLGKPPATEQAPPQQEEPKRTRKKREPAPPPPTDQPAPQQPPQAATQTQEAPAPQKPPEQAPSQPAGPKNLWDLDDADEAEARIGALDEDALRRSTVTAIAFLGAEKARAVRARFPKVDADPQGAPIDERRACLYALWLERKGLV